VPRALRTGEELQGGDEPAIGECTSDQHDAVVDDDAPQLTSALINVA